MIPGYGAGVAVGDGDAVAVAVGVTVLFAVCVAVETLVANGVAISSDGVESPLNGLQAAASKLTSANANNDRT